MLDSVALLLLQMEVMVALAPVVHLYIQAHLAICHKYQLIQFSALIMHQLLMLLKPEAAMVGIVIIRLLILLRQFQVEFLLFVQLLVSMQKLKFRITIKAELLLMLLHLTLINSRNSAITLSVILTSLMEVKSSKL